jgi:hypothetical protein
MIKLTDKIQDTTKIPSVAPGLYNRGPVLSFLKKVGMPEGVVGGAQKIWNTATDGLEMLLPVNVQRDVVAEKLKQQLNDMKDINGLGPTPRVIFIGFSGGGQPSVEVAEAIPQKASFISLDAPLAEGRIDGVKSYTHFHSSFVGSLQNVRQTPAGSQVIRMPTLESPGSAMSIDSHQVFFTDPSATKQVLAEVIRHASDGVTIRTDELKFTPRAAKGRAVQPPVPPPAPQDRRRGDLREGSEYETVRIAGKSGDPREWRWNRRTGWMDLWEGEELKERRAYPGGIKPGNRDPSDRLWTHSLYAGNSRDEKSTAKPHNPRLRAAPVIPAGNGHGWQEARAGPGRRIKGEKRPSEARSMTERNSGFLKNYRSRTVAEIKKSIRSLERQIQRHEAKIADPTKHCAGFGKLPLEDRGNLIEKKWPRDIRRQKEQMACLRELLEERG